MRYCRFLKDGLSQYGEIERDGDEDYIVRLLPPPPEDKEGIFRSPDIKRFPLSTVKLLAPVLPGKIVCVGRNYREHAKELGNEVPADLLIFLKPPSSLQHPAEPIRLPKISQRVDYEGEVAVILDKQCSRLGQGANVQKYIRGYTAANDVTARDLQKKDGQWTRAKGFDTFCPVGPIVSDEIDVMAGVELCTRVNGELRQQGNTRDFIFSLEQILRYISGIMTLFPGDLILTGTPAGVGPLQPGDRVEVSVAGLPPLQNPAARQIG